MMWALGTGIHVCIYLYIFVFTQIRFADPVITGSIGTSIIGILVGDRIIVLNSSRLAHTFQFFFLSLSFS